MDGQIRFEKQIFPHAEKNLRFRKYPNPCGRGPLSVADTTAKSAYHSSVSEDRNKYGVVEALYSNHTETIIKYFVTNLYINNHKTQNRSGHLVY